MNEAGPTGDDAPVEQVVVVGGPDQVEGVREVVFNWERELESVLLG